jgi:hypothetical protein
MAGPEFFQTAMGQQFYGGAVPKLISEIARVADALGLQKNIPMDALLASDCLNLLRKARDEAPVEWDALAHSGSGGAAICKLWDILKRVEG